MTQAIESDATSTCINEVQGDFTIETRGGKSGPPHPTCSRGPEDSAVHTARAAERIECLPHPAATAPQAVDQRSCALYGAGRHAAPRNPVLPAFSQRKFRIGRHSCIRRQMMHGQHEGRHSIFPGYAFGSCDICTPPPTRDACRLPRILCARVSPFQRPIRIYYALYALS